MKKKYNRVCFVATPYALLLYLLSCSEEEMDDTLFVTNGVIGDLNLDAVDVKAVAKHYERAYAFWNKRRLGLVVDYFVRRKLLKQVSSKAQVFAQDHVSHAHVVIGRKKYTWIEDSQNVLSSITSTDNPFYNYFRRCTHRPKTSMYYVYRLMYGDLVSGSYAHNKHCTKLLLSYDDPCPDTLHIPREIIDFKQAWRTAGPRKKERILSVFKVDGRMLQSIERFPVILFTQNLYAYRYVSVQEQVELYKRIIDKYGVSKVLVKTHPDDKIPYEKYIPSLHVLRGSIPSQLLGLLGMQNKILATVFSSAVFSIESKRIDWYLDGLPRQLRLKIFSHIPPVPVNHCKL